MWASLVSSGGALPKGYAVVYLIVAIIDAIILLGWGDTFTTGSGWCVFALLLIRLTIACVLCVGVYKGHIWKCKIFCVIESVLIFSQFIVLITILETTGQQIYTLVVLPLRVIGIQIIHGYLIVLKSDLGIFV